MFLGFITTSYGQSQCVDFLRPLHEQEVIHVILNEFEFPSQYNMKTTNPNLRLALYNAFGGRDFFTGQKMTFQEMTVDHVLPKSKGGPNNIYNYVPTVQLHNSTKGNLIDQVATIGVLSIIRTVYAEKVIAELDKLHGLPQETRVAMQKSSDPRKIALNDTGQVREARAKYKRIQMVESPSRDFQLFLTDLRDHIKSNPSDVNIIGPTAVIDVTRILTDTTLAELKDYKRISQVRTEIQFDDGQVQTPKHYPLLQNIVPPSNKNPGTQIYITRKLYEKFIQLEESEFQNFLNTGLLLENAI